MKKTQRTYIILFLFCLIGLNRNYIYAGGVRGTVYDDHDEPLAFTSIYVKETGQGSASNPEGYFEINLDPGTYNIIFQFLGYKTQLHVINISDDYLDLDIHFLIQDFVLSNITFRAGEDDPAYAIMRRAIAKSKYHLLQVDTFNTTVYVKGAGRVLEVPFLLRKRLKKEGIDSTKVFLVESVSELSFKQPNTYHENVISIRSSEDEGTPSPMQYIQNSFYEPKIEEAISPFNPNAFSYYKYRYIGAFEDKGVSVFKIEVIPKVRGDRIFEGYLNIIDNLWAIHSLELKTIYQGFDFVIKQIYEPVERNVWMPVFHQFLVSGAILGFKIEFKYVATAKEYTIELNKDLKPLENDVFNLETDKLETINHDVIPVIEKDGELSKKEMKKILKEYEMESRNKREEPEVVIITSREIDTLAYSQDSAYWKRIRPIPLTNLEFTSYHQKDSVTRQRREREEKDSIRNEKNRKFRPHHIIVGNQYTLSDNMKLKWHSILNTISFNTVDGWNLKSGFDLRWAWNESGLTITPILRYGFSRKDWNWKTNISYHSKSQKISNTYGLAFGHYIYQINENKPIQYWLNMFTTLLLKENYAKLHEKSFFRFHYSGDFEEKAGIDAHLEWSNRNVLENNSDFSLVKYNDKEFTSNNPANITLEDTRYSRHDVLLLNFNMHWKPFIKYRIHNGNRQAIKDSSPEFFLGTKLGIPNMLESKVNFANFEAGGSYGIEFGVANRIDLQLRIGKFFNKKNLYFPDFVHFQGNQTPLITTDLISSYRLLDYYYYSTDDSYLSFHMFYQFRQLLITQILYARLAGLREDIFLHYLTTPAFTNYLELGYAIDNIFRFIRLEVAVQFNGMNHTETGFRIGISKAITLE